MTPLDSALQAAQADPGKENDFYNDLFNTDLFVPEETPGSFLTVFEDGKYFVPVFDTLERLEAWSDGDSAHVNLRADAIFEMLSGDVHLILNPGTDYCKEFIPQEIDWLKEVIRSHQEEAQNESMLIGAPEKLPPELIERLTLCLKKNPDVTEAYLAKVELEETCGDTSQLLLVLRADAITDEIFQAVLKEVGVATQDVLSDSHYMDILKYSDQEPFATIAANIKPFYVSE